MEKFSTPTSSKLVLLTVHLSMQAVFSDVCRKGLSHINQDFIPPSLSHIPINLSPPTLKVILIGSVMCYVPQMINYNSLNENLVLCGPAAEVGI